jgi:hypothetical protein
MADGTIGENLNQVQKNALELKGVFADIRDNINYLNQGLDDSSKFSRDFVTEVRKSVLQSNKLSKIIGDVKDGVANTKELVRQKNAAEARSLEFQSKSDALYKKAQAYAGAQKTSLLKAAEASSDLANNAKNLAAGFQAAAEANVNLNKNAQFFSRMGKLASQIPGLGKLSGTFNDAAAAIRKADLEGKVLEEQINQGIKAAFEGLAKAIGVEFLAQIFKVNKEITSFQKNLNLGYFEAIGVKAQFAAIETLSNDIAINSVRIAEANAELNSQLGTAAVFSGELLGTFSKLTKVVGLSSEAAGSLAQQALISGQEFRTVEENTLGASYALQRSSGIALNNKEILEATGKVTGQVRANLGSNPELIAQAVTKAKLLGTELETIANTSKSLLSFESSIGAELEAELLTGKQLNLERARALALQGDLVGVADEIARQNINFSEFGEMNVLQQDALAKAVGMTSDGLSDMLMKQEAMGKTAKELRAIGKGELADRIEALDAQEKIALAAEKFQVFLGNIATILSPIADLVGFIAQAFSTLPGKVALVAIGFAKLIPLLNMAALKSITGAIAAMFTGAGPLGIASGILGAAALTTAIAQTTGILKVDDAVLFNPEDKFSLVASTSPGALAQATSDIAGGGGVSDEQIGKLASIINSKEVRFDSYAASGPQGIVNTERRQPSNLFA